MNGLTNVFRRATVRSNSKLLQQEAMGPCVSAIRSLLVALTRSSDQLRRIGIADFHMILPGSLGSDLEFPSQPDGWSGEFRSPDRNIFPRTQLLAPWPMVVAEAMDCPGNSSLWRCRRARVLVSASNPVKGSRMDTVTYHELVRHLLEQTDHRVILLTNNAAVGSELWLDLFRTYRQRITVGFVVPTLNDEALAKLDPGGSSLPARFRAYRSLHRAGVATCAFLCPSLPDLVPHLDVVFREIQVERLSTIWAAPMHGNHWRLIREAFDEGSPEDSWLSSVFAHGQEERWSRFAADFYLRLALKGRAEGWFSKVRFLLDEQRIRPLDALLFDQLDRVILLGPTDADGYSQNPSIRRQQRKAAFWDKTGPEVPKGNPKWAQRC